jgi:hypothetical protein
VVGYQIVSVTNPNTSLSLIVQDRGVQLSLALGNAILILTQLQ